MSYPAITRQSPYKINATANTPAITRVIRASFRKCIGTTASEIAVDGRSVPHDRWVLR